MKSERLKGMPPSNPRTFNYYISVQTLPRERNCSEFSNSTEESDVEEYYPFVIGRGKNFKIIDPKLYKQLRKHNIKQRVPVWVADCAKKTPYSKSKKETNRSGRVSPPSGIDSEDEYCELSPLAKPLPPPLPPRKNKLSALKQETDLCRDFKKAPTLEKRLDMDCFNPKPCIVEKNPSSPSSMPTTRLATVDKSSKTPWTRNEKGSGNTDGLAKGTLCGLETDEVIDYATCMCCVKGLFYHCTKDLEDEGRVADEPCSCSGPLKSCLPRWGCLAVLSVFLPCLWCYLPIAACRKAVYCASCKSKKVEKRKARKETRKR